MPPSERSRSRRPVRYPDAIPFLAPLVEEAKVRHHSQREIARLASMSEQAFSMLCKGLHRPSLAKIPLLARALASSSVSAAPLARKLADIYKYPQARLPSTTLSVAYVDHPPFLTRDNSGVWRGVFVDLLGYVGRHLDRPLGEYRKGEPLSWADLVAALEENKADIAAAPVFRIPERVSFIQK